MNDIFLKKIVQDAIQVKYESVGVSEVQIQANTPKKKSKVSIKACSPHILLGYMNTLTLAPCKEP